MPIASRIMGSGISALAATNIVGDFAGGLTAAGSSQATALQLNAAVNYVTTTASSTGVLIPTMNIGDSCEVHNAGANTLSAYGGVGLGIAIQGGSANAAFSIATNKNAIFRQVTATAITAILSA